MKGFTTWKGATHSVHSTPQTRLRQAIEQIELKNSSFNSLIAHRKMAQVRQLYRELLRTARLLVRTSLGGC